MLSAQDLETFERDGIVKIPAAFSADDAARMRDVLWSELKNRHGMDRDDRSTWTTLRPTGLKTTKRHPVANAILGARRRGEHRLAPFYVNEALFNTRHLYPVTD